jgi:hypothetical protein
MKKSSLLILASIALISATLGFSQPQSTDETIALPTVSTTTSRYTPAEKAVNESLNQLRSQASSDVLIGSELPLLKPATSSPETLAKILKATRRSGLAKS